VHGSLRRLIVRRRSGFAVLTGILFAAEVHGEMASCKFTIRHLVKVIASLRRRAVEHRSLHSANIADTGLAGVRPAVRSPYLRFARS
jgi:hypothetical protein